MSLAPLNRGVIITGAASGIGRAIAQEAAVAGANALFLTDIDSKGLRQTAGLVQSETNVETLTADLADPEAAAMIYGKAMAAFPNIDGLVNAAGVTDRARIVDGSAEIWDRLFAINARAPFLLMQAAIKEMLERRVSGAIVNIQSVNAHCGAPDLAIYSASKGALQTLTKNAANAHLKDQIRVNGINLGWTLTEAEHQMQSKVLGSGEDWAERAAQELPLGRLVMPGDAARLAVFLLSDVSAPMTGACIDLEQSVLGAPA